MPGLAIVAIPNQDDYVWKLSSEKVPHMTLLYLGDEEVDPIALDRIQEYLEHVVDTSLCKFGMSVDHRGELGEKNADVLFFDKDRCNKKLLEVRSYLLRQLDIFTLYNSTEQFPGWVPHLTMGYPETPAKADTRDYPGINWVNFDVVALWTGDYDGVDFRLDDRDNARYWSFDNAENSSRLSETIALGEEYLTHHGTKGMKWGVRRAEKKWGRNATKSSTSRKIWNSSVVEGTAAIQRINAKPAYRNGVSHSPELSAKYHGEVAASLRGILQKNADATLGKSPSGQHKAQVQYSRADGEHYKVVIVDV